MSETQKLSISAKIREAGKHTIIYGLGSVAQSASGLILLPILTGSLTNEDFGAYSLILMFSGIISAIFYFGMSSALPRSYFDYESASDRSSVFTTAFIILFAGAILQSFIGFTFNEKISLTLFKSEKYSAAVGFAFFGGALGFVNTYFLCYLRLLRKSIASIALSLASLGGTIGLTLHYLSNQDSDILAPFKAASYTQGIITIIFILVYGRSAFSRRLKINELPNLLKFGFASLVASFGGLLVDSLDRFMIQHYMDLVKVGEFSAALRVSMLINVALIMPFNQIWSPMMMEYRTKSNIKELFTKVFSAFMMAGGFIISIASLFASEILPILIRSEITLDVTYIFITCIVGMLIVSATNFFSAGLFYERKVYLLPFAYYGVAALKYLINSFLIPLFGLIGAALSVLISSLMLPMAIYALSKKYFKFEIEWSRLGLYAIIILPAIFYGYNFADSKSLSISTRVAWILFEIFLIYKFCINSDEKKIIKKYITRKY